MKGSIRIGIDLDGTLAAYQAEVVKFMNKTYGTSLKLRDVKRDDCYDVLGSNIFARAFKLRKFYGYSHSLSDIKPVKGSVSAVEKLRKAGYRLFIVTSRFKGFSRKTSEWLDRHFGRGMFEKVKYSSILASSSRIFKAGKYAKLSADAVVEDSYYVAKKCAKLGIKALLLDYSWNKGPKVSGVVRVKNWGEAVRKINSLKLPAN